MSLFEFILTLYSILMGLGLTLLIRSIGQMLEARRKTHTYWVHTCWLATLLVANVVFWLQLWLYRGVVEWDVPEVFLALSVPVLLYLVSHLAVPELDNGLQHDMRAYYYENHRLIQGLFFCAVLIAGFSQRLVLDRWQFGTRDWMRWLVLVMLVPGIVSRRPAVHAVQVVTLLAAILIAAFEALRPLRE